MFCPQCSQKQLSEEVRFCSRCGFPLEDVAEALKNNGVVERRVVESAKDLKKSLAIGLSAIILSGVFFVLSLIFGTPEPSYMVQFNLLVGLLGFLFGIIWIAYTFWLKPMKIVKESITDAGFMPVKQSQSFLPEQDLSNLAENFRSVNNGIPTNELKVSPSVTEGTTKLFRKDE